MIGVDIQPEMLDLLEARAEAAGVENIETVLGSIVDPNLEPGSIDLAILVDVYHEFSHPEQMLARLRESLAPGGRMVLLEFRAEDPEVPIKELHKMSRAQVEKELTGQRVPARRRVRRAALAAHDDVRRGSRVGGRGAGRLSQSSIDSIRWSNSAVSRS